MKNEGFQGKDEGKIKVPNEGIEGDDEGDDEGEIVVGKVMKMVDIEGLRSLNQPSKNHQSSSHQEP